MENNIKRHSKSSSKVNRKSSTYFCGAGSGKTRVLTHKIAYLIEKNIYAPENILALTFTNKAAKEMIKRSRKILKKENLSLKIGTFHSICAFILREEARHINLSPNFVIYDVKIN